MPSWSLSTAGIPGLMAAATLQLADYSVRVTDEHGLGLPPEALVAPGYVYQRTQLHPRIITLTLTPRMRLAHQTVTRESLVRLLVPESAPRVPLVLRYTGGLRTLEIPVVYAPESVPAGPDLDRSQGNPLVLRFVAYDPLWRSSTVSSSVLAMTGGFTMKYLMSRFLNSGWYTDLSTLNGAVRALLPATNTLYVGGDFTTPGTRVAKLTYSGVAGAYTWAAMDAGLDGSVRAFALGADGTLYAGGLFTNRVAKWTGSTWSALTTLAGGNIFALAMGNDGTLYAGGDFASAQVLYFSGGAWFGLGTPGMTVNALAIGADGLLYAGGVGALKQWNGTTWVTCGSLTGTIDALVVGLDGTLYLGGNFTVDGMLYVNVAAWNGYGLSALGQGLNGEVFALAVDSYGTLYAGGVFTAVNFGVTLPCAVALWSGSGWYCEDASLPGTETVYALAVGPADMQLTLGCNVTGSALVSGLQGVQTIGTAATAPVVTVTGPGRLYQLLNASTGAVLYFDLLLLASEVVTLDMVAGTITSSARGNLLGKLLPGSSWGIFKLTPNVDSGNYIFVFADTTVTGSISWQDRYYSLDGADA